MGFPTLGCAGLLGIAIPPGRFLEDFVDIATHLLPFECVLPTLECVLRTPEHNNLGHEIPGRLPDHILLCVQVSPNSSRDGCLLPLKLTIPPKKFLEHYVDMTNHFLPFEWVHLTLP